VISTLVYILIVVAILSLIFWVITQIPLPPIVRTVIYVIIGIVVLLWLLSFVQGAGPHFGYVR